jgi:hypothetical protein
VEDHTNPGGVPGDPQSELNSRGEARKAILQHILDLTRIHGALANLGHPIDKLTVRNLLRRHHLEPAPQRRKAGMSWVQFLKVHWEVLAATDFFTVEVATWHGLVTYYVLVVIELATRRVEIAGITPAPHGRLHAAMCSAVDRSLRRVPPWETISHP